MKKNQNYKMIQRTLQNKKAKQNKPWTKLETHFLNEVTQYCEDDSFP